MRNKEQASGNKKSQLTDAELQQATGGLSYEQRLDCKTIQDALTCLDNYSKGCMWKSKDGYCYNYKYNVVGKSEISNN